MYGFSTCWNIRRAEDVKTALAEIQSLGFDTIELNGLSEEQVREILEFDRILNEVKVVSIHNPCPKPKEELDRPIFNDNYFRENIDLVSKDPALRERSILSTKNTIDLAQALGAEVVILHLGIVEVGYVPGQVRRWVIKHGLGTEEYFVRLNPLLEKRREKREDFWPELIDSLEILEEYASAKGVKLGLENRSVFLQIPNLEELKFIFNQFGPNSSLGYWHDIGHAQLQDYLLIQSHEKLLQELRPWLLGIHIHDARITPPNPLQEINVMELGQEEYVSYLESGQLSPLVKDHLAPSFGQVDYAMISKYLEPDTLRVLELRPSVIRDNILQGTTFLQEINF
jgi:sugar phosphate isomerase/epimerase